MSIVCLPLMELPSRLDGKVADPFYLIVSTGTALVLTPILPSALTEAAEKPTNSRARRAARRGQQSDEEP